MHPLCHRYQYRENKYTHQEKYHDSIKFSYLQLNQVSMANGERSRNNIKRALTLGNLQCLVSSNVDNVVYQGGDYIF